MRQREPIAKRTALVNSMHASDAEMRQRMAAETLAGYRLQRQLGKHIKEQLKESDLIVGPFRRRPQLEESLDRTSSCSRASHGWNTCTPLGSGS